MILFLLLCTVKVIFYSYIQTYMHLHLKPYCEIVHLWFFVALDIS